MDPASAVYTASAVDNAYNASLHGRIDAAAGPAHLLKFHPVTPEGMHYGHHLLQPSKLLWVAELHVQADTKRITAKQQQWKVSV